MPLPPMTSGQRLALALAESERGLVEDLVSLRKKSSQSATDVAAKINRHKSSVSKFEAMTTDPHLSTVFRYAHAVEAMVEIRVRPFSQWERIQSIRQRTVSVPNKWVDEHATRTTEYNRPLRVKLSA